MSPSHRKPAPALKGWALACAAVLLLALPAVARAPQEPPGQKQDARVALGAAQAAMERKDYVTAARLLENFLLEQPGQVEALFNLAYCYTLLDRTADAIDTYRETLEVDPKLFSARLNLGLLLLNTNQPVEAAAELERARELDPKNYRAHYYAGVALERSGKKEEALERYRHAAELDPKKTEPRRALLELLLEKGNLAEAEAVVEQLRQLQPDDARLLRLRADLQLEQGRPGDALAAYEEYLKAEPQDAEAHLAVGRLYRAEGRAEEALPHFLAAEQTGGPGHAWTAAYESARTLAALKRYGEAIPRYRRALELMGDDVDVEVNAELGHALLEDRQYGEAARVLSQVVQADPDRAEAYNQLASALYLGGDLAGAIGALDRRAAHAEETMGTLFLRAVSYDKLRQCGPAIDYYEKFLTLNGEARTDQYFQATGRLRLLRNVCRERRR